MRRAEHVSDDRGERQSDRECKDDAAQRGERREKWKGQPGARAERQDAAGDQEAQPDGKVMADRVERDARRGDEFLQRRELGLPPELPDPAGDAPAAADANRPGCVVITAVRT